MNSAVNRVVGVFGGTFDPIHNGHLQMAREAQQSLALDEVRFIPCHRPPHRGRPQLTSEQRLSLLDLALVDQPYFTRDDLELHRQGPSYTVDTLKHLRASLGVQVSLVLMMGADAFAQLTSWHQWQQLRDLAHIAVMTRPGTELPQTGVLATWLAAADEPNVVQQQAAGGVVVLQQSLLAISATAIRARLAENGGVNRDDSSRLEIPAAVADYINRHQLYR